MMILNSWYQWTHGLVSLSDVIQQYVAVDCFAFEQYYLNDCIKITTATSLTLGPLNVCS